MCKIDSRNRSRFSTNYEASRVYAQVQSEVVRMNADQRSSDDLSVGDFLIQFSVVISGEILNPTILNPDFLAVRNIVPTEWEWDVSQVVTTPVLSLVSYTNGLSITVEPSKLQIVDAVADMEGSAPNSKTTEIVRRYVSALPHVRYTAVGVNFVSAIERANPENFLRSKFLKQGSWDSPSHPLSAVGLRLAYPLGNGRLLLTLDTGQAGREDEGREGEEPANLMNVILASANFHRDCDAYPADKQIETYLDAVTDDWTTHRNLLQDILRTED